MARVRQVTRTGEEEVCEVLVCDIVERTTAVVSVCVVASLDEKRKAKAIETACKALNGNYAVVSVLSSVVNEVLYAMDECEFIKLAKKLPPRATKETEEANEECEEV